MRFLVFSFFVVFSFQLSANTFAPFQGALDKHLKDVSNQENFWQTAFDYQGAHSDPSSLRLIDQQKEKLKSFSVDTLTDKNSALAFWINSYNFFMIETVLRAGFEGSKLKIKSVKDLGSWLSPYATFKEKVHQIGGNKYSLDQIEKKILLGEEFKKKGWKDARIHFAVNCASVGCPPLQPKVYSAESLDQMLVKNLKKSFKTKRHLHSKGESVYVSHLFKWYKSDFDEHSGSVKEFILKFIDNPKMKSLLKKDPGFSYIEYDWRLNKPSHF